MLFPESRGVAEGMIGVNAAMSPIGILLLSPIIPVAAKKFGTKPTAIVAALLTALLTPCYKIFPSLEAWFVLRLVHGILISTLFVLSESWIVKFANGKQRGRIVAIYASVLSASFATGPALIGWIGIDGWEPFIISTCVLLLGTLPLLLVVDKPGEVSEEASASNFFTIAAKAPMLLASVATFAVFDAATLSLMAVYAVRTGLDLATAAYTLTALIAGNIFLQYPIGWLADRVAKRAILTGCASMTLVLLLLVPHVMGSIWMWPVLVLAGSTGYGMYTVALAALGDRFDGDELVAGMAAYATMWGTGALVGATIAGWAMSGFGPHGLPYVLAAIYAIYLAAMAKRSSSQT